MNKIILFGAGKRAPYFIEKMRFFGLNVDFFVDNNEKLQGQTLSGFKICQPSILSQDCIIIITCKETETIYAQLMSMGLEQQVVTEVELWILCYQKLKEENYLFPFSQHEQTTVVFELLSRDMYFSKWGGTEIWSYNVAEKLLEHRREVVLFMKRGNLNEDIPNLPAELFDSSPFTITDIIERLVLYLPCVVVANISDVLLAAALVLKKFVPDQVRVISMLHIDNSGTYEKSVIYKDFIDTYMCVSTKIKRELIQTYKIPETKVCFKESMIVYDKAVKKQYHTQSSQPLSIGYACRLVRIQKRTHLLSNIIQRLEQAFVNYILEIAGDGECYSELQQFIEENKLGMKVRLLGHLNKAEMKEYWKRQDIYLNLSSFEGTSLAMLEAMSYGCIPVVTDVSGVDEFVEHHRNGCVVEVDKTEKAADEICFLEKRRDLLPVYGSACRKIIKEKCDPDDYLSYMENIMSLDGGLHDKGINTCSDL